MITDLAAKAAAKARPPAARPHGRGLHRHHPRGRAGPAARPRLPAHRPASGHRRDPGRHPARHIAAGPVPRRSPHADAVLFPADVHADPEGLRQPRPGHLHVHHRARTRPEADQGQRAQGRVSSRCPRSACLSSGGALLALCALQQPFAGRPAPTAITSRSWPSRCSSAPRCASRRSRCSRASSTSADMARTPLGVIALACAAIDDVVGLVAACPRLRHRRLHQQPLWEVLALVGALHRGDVRGDHARCWRASWCRSTTRAGRLTPDVLAFLLVGLIFSAWITDRIGIHFIFGAFVFGLVMPREGTEMLFHRNPGAAGAGQRASAAADLLHHQRAFRRPHEADRQRPRRDVRRARRGHRRQVHRRLLRRPRSRHPEPTVCGAWLADEYARPDRARPAVKWA